MQQENVILDYIQTLIWPLTLILVLAAGVRLVSSYFARSRYATVADASASAPRPTVETLDRLGASIRESEELASLNSHPQDDPIVHVRGAVKLAPKSYRDTLQKILGCVDARQVIVLDLATADDGTASRIVDFCSGIALGTKGSIYQVSSTTLILIPKAS